MKVGDLVRVQGSGRINKILGIVLSEPYRYFEEQPYWNEPHDFIVVDVRFFGRSGLKEKAHQYTIDQLEVVSESR